MSTAVAALLALLSFFPMPESVSITVTIVVGEQFVDVGPPWFPCNGVDEVGDIREGGIVLIRDGRLDLAEARLRPGKRVDGDCRFTLVFHDVPARDRYIIYVGAWPANIYTFEDLAKQDFQVLMLFAV